jgi:lambda family phage portal protein
MNPVQRFWSRLFPAKSARRSVFAGAQMGRLTGDFVGQFIGPNLELRTELATLRMRARDLERNNCFARRYIGLLSEHVVGPKGIRLQSLAVRKDGTPDEKARALIEQQWAAWGQACDPSGRLSWLDIQRLAIKNIGRDGEGLVRHLDGFENPFGYAVQLLDPDLLDEGYNAPRDPNGAAVVMSVQVDTYDRPLGYWLYRSHPYELTGRTRERVFVPAREIEHLYQQRRPGQVRGESWLAPVMIPLRMLAGYSEAELVAARTAASKMGWIVRKDGEDVLPVEGAKDQALDAAPGVIGRLDPGEEFQQWDPTHPGGNFDPFTRAILREVAAGLGVSYSTLTGDLSQANYGSQRGGMLMERDGWRVHQQWMAHQLHSRVFRRWLTSAIKAGALPGLRIADLDRHLPAVWQPRGWTWIDPLKDVNAAILAINAGLNSRRRVLGDEGIDITDIVAELGSEKELFDAAGITLLGAGSTSTPMPTDSEDGDSEDGEDATANSQVAATGQQLQTTTETVLNGAQVVAALDIVKSVADGSLPRDAGIAMLQILFNLDLTQAEQMMGSAGTGSPTTPNPVPMEELPNGEA